MGGLPPGRVGKPETVRPPLQAHAPTRHTGKPETLRSPPQAHTPTRHTGTDAGATADTSSLPRGGT